MKEKGQQGRIERIPVRRWVSPDKKNSTTVGYSDEKSSDAKWLIYEGNDASMRFFDNGADGSVDRIIIDNEARPHGSQQKSAENDLKTFSSINELADDASVEANLDPQDIKVYEISFENGQFVVRSVDFQSGDSSELTGPDAEELVSKVQNSFTNSMESVEAGISK
ncbi:MAG: hypothetical protein ABIJ81_01305 [Patescibacteria group bacterium]